MKGELIELEHLQLKPPEYYRELDLKVSIEFRFQLNVKQKLLCNCPVLPYKDEYDMEVLRHLRVPPQHGTFESAFLIENRCPREIIYKVSADTACTYEIDDSPPITINKEAVSMAFEIARSLNCSVAKEAFFMRKPYLNGSIPSGFHRSALIGWNGHIDYEDLHLEIQRVTLEEDSARLLEESGRRRVYALDRMGIPMVEITLKPFITTPHQAAEVLRFLKIVMDVGEWTKRDLSSIRTELNVSIKGGNRVEIRNIQRSVEAARVVDLEVQRQKQLIDITRILNKRGQPIQPEYVDITRYARELTKSPHERVFAVLLKGVRGVLNHPLGPNRVLFDELLEYVHATACIPQDMIFYSEGEDFIAFEGIFNQAQQLLKPSRLDVIVLLVGTDKQLPLALLSLKERYFALWKGPLEESRLAIPSGESVFLRPLPRTNTMFVESELPAFQLLDNDNAKIFDWKDFFQIVEAIGWQKTRLIARKGLFSEFRKLVKSGLDYVDAALRVLGGQVG